MSPASRLDGLEISLIRQVFDAAPSGAINLGLGEPIFATPAAILAAAHEALDAGRLAYTTNAGLPDLRRAIARYARSGIGAESVCVTVGATEALLATMLAWVDPGDQVLVPDPGHPTYAAVAQIAGAEPVAYSLPATDGFRFSAASLAPRITPKTRAIVLNSPANPTGRVIPRRELERVAELASRHDLLVISDEVYRELYFGERPASYVEVSDGGFVVGGLSKAVSMTGWRLGWVVAAAERILPISVIHQYAVTCAPTLSQKAALAAFDTDLAQQSEGARRRLEERRDLMAEFVEEKLALPYLMPEGTFYLMVEAAPNGDSLAVALELLERARVITVPGAAFGSEASRYLRLSFSASKEEIREGIDRLGACLRSFSKRDHNSRRTSRG